MIDPSTEKNQKAQLSIKDAYAHRNEQLGELEIDCLPTLTDAQNLQLSQEVVQLIEIAATSDAETMMQAFKRLDEIFKYPSIETSEDSAKILISIGANEEEPIPIRNQALKFLARILINQTIISPDDMLPVFSLIGPDMLDGTYISVFNYVDNPMISQTLLQSDFMDIIIGMLPSLSNKNDIDKVFRILVHFVSRQEDYNNELGRALIPILQFGLTQENTTFFENSVHLLDITLRNCLPAELFNMIIENNIDSISVDRFPTVRNYYRPKICNIFINLTVNKMYGEALWKRDLLTKINNIRSVANDEIMRKLIRIWCNLTSYDDIQYVMCAEENGYIEIAAQMMSIGTIKEKKKAAMLYKNICNYALNDSIQEIIIGRNIVPSLVDLLQIDEYALWKPILEALSRLVEIIYIIDSDAGDFLSHPFFAEVDQEQFYDTAKHIYESDYRFTKENDPRQLALQFMEAIDDESDEDGDIYSRPFAASNSGDEEEIDFEEDDE